MTYGIVKAPRAAQVVKISLCKEEVEAITKHLEILDELTDDPRADVKDEIQYIVAEMIANLARTGGWFGSVTDGGGG